MRVVLRPFLLATAVIAFPMTLARAQSPVANTSTTKSYALGDSLPVDHSAIIGKLPNGLTYYIRRVEKPACRVELRLAVRAGSLQEDDDQQGLAHMVEHMQFNGSPHFPKKGDLIKYFQSIGMTFGADLNAFTTFDQTVYEIRIPTDSVQQLKRGFDVLQDWAGQATFKAEDVLIERGIVYEEWRKSLGAGKRITDHHFPVFYKGSRYAERLPIGDPETLKTATLAKLQRFYRDWYRPDLMAVIAVGDLDPVQAEQWIKERFSQLTNPSQSRPVKKYSIPENVESLLSIVADTEVTGMSIGVMYKQPATTLGTVGEYRNNLVKQLFMSALNQRLFERGFGERPPFLGASASFGGMGSTVETFEVQVNAQNGELTQGLDAALSEVERIARFGITDSELTRMRESMLRSMKIALPELDEIQSGAYVGTYLGHFMAGALILDRRKMIDITQQLLPTISVDEIKEVATVWRQKNNRIITVTLPKSSEVLVPDSNAILSIFEDVSRAPLLAYTDPPVKKKLMTNSPKGGKIIAKRDLTQGITEWSLSNGIRVLVKPSSNSTSQILISGSGPGGYSQAMNNGPVPALLAAGIVQAGGVADFGPIELGKVMAPYAVRVQASISQYDQSVSATARLEDLEAALQLMYLKVTQPRIDPATVSAMKLNMRMSLMTRNASPERVFDDTVKLTMARYNPFIRATILTEATIDAVDAEKSLAVFRKCFEDMSTFDFVIVGNFTPDSIAPLIAQYLGALPGKAPSTPRTAPAQVALHDLGLKPPDGIVRKTVALGTEPKATTIMTFHGPVEVTLKSDWDFYGLIQILRMRLFERLRMQMSGTYGVSVGGTFSSLPAPRRGYSLSVVFISDPDRVDEMTKAAIAVMDSMRIAPPTALEMNIVREQRLHQLELEEKSDGTVLGSLDAFNREGWSFDKLQSSEEFIRNWKPEDVTAAARRYFNFNQYAQFHLVPATRSTARSE